VTATVESRSYGLETFPTNLSVLERALDVLAHRRAPDIGGAPALISAAIRRAETMVGADGRLVGIQDLGAHATLYELGRLQNHAGHRAAAELSFRRVLEIEERLIGPDQATSGQTLSWIGLIVGYQGRFAEAERLFARADDLVSRSLSAYDRPRHLGYRAEIDAYRGDTQQAIARAREGEAMFERLGAENGRASLLLPLAAGLRGLGRLAEAEEAAQRALGLVDKAGPDPYWRSYWVGELHSQLGQILVDRGRFADARIHFEAALKRRRLLSGDSVRAYGTLGQLAALARREGQREEALGLLRQRAQIAIRDPVVRGDARPDGQAAYLDVLFEAAETWPQRREAYLAEVFAAVQIPRGSEAAKAVTTMAARVLTTDPAVRDASRAFQDATRRRDRVRYALALEILEDPIKRDPAKERALKSDLRAVEELMVNLERELQATSPRYARLMAAEPLAAADAAPLLRADEALLSFLVTQDRTYVLIFRAGRVHAHSLRLGRRTLDARVKELRAGLTIEDGRLPRFDAQLSYRLYQQLLAPLAGHLAGATHVLVVPSGALLSLPLGVLVTEPPPAAGDDYRDIAWFGRRFAVSVLPSVSALRDLRAVAGLGRAPRPFIGFGDPVLAGESETTRGLASLGMVCRGTEPLDASVVRALPRLPETAAELTQIAQVLGADPSSSVILGKAATKPTVLSADLRPYRVVAFATHGLLPGELRCKTEPALVLTPPAVATAADDGLLSASDVTQLRLDADWVILSACNTAAGGLGGESLSGLTQAFFYAGARALLVSHWAVVSRATVELVAGTLTNWVADPALGRAEALRRAQGVLAEKTETSHPVFWAAFVLVGDGAVGTTRALDR
jgi:CHAT domain-containing protein